MIHLKAGDKVMLNYGGGPIEGQVIYASPNGRSLVIGTEFIIGGCVGTCPALWDEEEGSFITLITGEKIEIGRMVTQ